MVRHDRAKRAKKAMTFYRINYGVKPPYHVLLDPEFVVTSLEKKVFIKSSIPELLAGTSLLVVTRCVTAALRAGGESQSGAALMAKRLQHEECHHDRPIDAHECIYSLLITQETREKKLCLASQDYGFRKRARALPGVPILHIYNNMIILDPPSTASAKTAEDKARTHRALGSVEQQLVKKATPLSSPDEEPDKKAIPQRILKSKRRAKGPNPMSMLKKGALKKRVQKAEAKKKSNQQSAKSGDTPKPNKQDQPSAQQATEPGNGDASGDQTDKRKRKRKRKHAGSKKKATAAADGGQDTEHTPPGEGGQTKRRRVEESAA